MLSEVFLTAGVTDVVEVSAASDAEVLEVDGVAASVVLVAVTLLSSSIT